MVDVAKPSTADAGNMSRPEKPDEAKYMEDLAKAEKDHAAKMEQYVCTLHDVTRSFWGRPSR